MVIKIPESLIAVQLSLSPKIKLFDNAIGRKYINKNVSMKSEGKIS